MWLVESKKKCESWKPMIASKRKYKIFLGFCKIAGKQHDEEFFLKMNLEFPPKKFNNFSINFAV